MTATMTDRCAALSAACQQLADAVEADATRARDLATAALNIRAGVDALGDDIGPQVDGFHYALGRARNLLSDTARKLEEAVVLSTVAPALAVNLSDAQDALGVVAKVHRA